MQITVFGESFDSYYEDTLEISEMLEKAGVFALMDGFLAGEPSNAEILALMKRIPQVFRLAGDILKRATNKDDILSKRHTDEVLVEAYKVVEQLLGSLNYLFQYDGINDLKKKLDTKTNGEQEPGKNIKPVGKKV